MKETKITKRKDVKVIKKEEELKEKENQEEKFVDIEVKEESGRDEDGGR